jgi:hypothetical protein
MPWKSFNRKTFAAQALDLINRFSKLSCRQKLLGKSDVPIREIRAENKLSYFAFSFFLFSAENIAETLLSLLFISAEMPK